jgi:hypothetical protein
MGMTELIPNLEDLCTQLPTDSTVLDAHEFVAELATAVSADGVNMKVDALVDRWLEVADDRGA